MEQNEPEKKRPSHAANAIRRSGKDATSWSVHFMHHCGERAKKRRECGGSGVFWC
jgi:hypothetical protein